MSPKRGDIVEMAVTKVMGYACWGAVGDKIGFSHCVDWSVQKPVPDEQVPVVGQVLKARVFYLDSRPVQEQPADVTCEGTIHVDFGCSPALVDESLWKQFLEKQGQPKD